MKSHQPRVSIGLPVYNGDRYLKGALDSLLAQTFKDFELIISDNGSTDRTQEICRTYAAKDRRIRYYRSEQNKGAGWNFNRVFELSTGEYFRWACDDDLCAPELLEQCVKVLDCHSAVILSYPKTIVIDEHGQALEKYEDGFDLRSSKPHERFMLYHERVRYGHGCHPFYGLIRKKALEKMLPLGSYPSSDLVLLGELTLHGKFYEVPKYLFLKRDHPNNSVRAHRAFKDRIAWYDPTKKGRLHLTRWKWFLEYLKAVQQAPIGWFEKARCYLQMLRWVTWNWVWLTKDLLKALSWPILKLFFNYGLHRQHKEPA